MRPTEREVSKVMHDTGMDRMQAYRHVESRNLARALEAKKRKNNAYPHD